MDVEWLQNPCTPLCSTRIREQGAVCVTLNSQSRRLFERENLLAEYNKYGSVKLGSQNLTRINVLYCKEVTAMKDEYYFPRMHKGCLNKWKTAEECCKHQVLYAYKPQIHRPRPIVSSSLFKDSPHVNLER